MLLDGADGRVILESSTVLRARRTATATGDQRHLALRIYSSLSSDVRRVSRRRYRGFCASASSELPNGMLTTRSAARLDREQPGQRGVDRRGGDGDLVVSTPRGPLRRCCSRTPATSGRIVTFV